MTSNCKECGCACKKCISINDHDVLLHLEIENLKQRLFEKESHIVSMETNFLNEANKFPKGEVGALREELLTWQDKYKRLLEAHKRVQRVNQGLEDKLLKLVDVCETDKSSLTKDVATLSQKLAEANYAIKKLTEDNERYKSDVSLAVQFLQCKQSNFVAHKYDSLPQEIQNQVGLYMGNKINKRKPEEKKPNEMKSIKVPIPTFPPTAMVYSVPKSPGSEYKDSESEGSDIVSAAIMAKVLEERQRERALVKHCDSCTCSKTLQIVCDNSKHTIGTQTDFRSSETQPNPKPETKKNNLERMSCAEAASNFNIVKVQPNNFLIDKSNSNSSVDLSVKPVKNNLMNPNIHVLSSELSREVSFHSVNEKKTKKPSRLYQHRVSNIESSKKTHSEESKKEMHSNISMETSSSQTESAKESRGSENLDNQNQRVAEWIEKNLERGITVAGNELDRDKYAEMEENVKKFLFGESAFLKTVEIGKKKYGEFLDKGENLDKS